MDDTSALTPKNFADVEPLARHVSGKLQMQAPDMESENWGLPKMQTMRKGPLVLSKGSIAAGAADTDIAKIWGIYNDTMYDLTDYVWSLSPTQNSPTFARTDGIFDIQCTVSSSQYIPSGVWMNSVGALYQLLGLSAFAVSQFYSPGGL
ncbi:hypothetical protein BYT27DRAFT_7259492 [Phlegmacium glaucopus]|nr:hypothetical protein BYT27DRAFT_7259492 [Phlegmacium glaucopus]